MGEPQCGRGFKCTLKTKPYNFNLNHVGLPSKRIPETDLLLPSENGARTEREQTKTFPERGEEEEKENVSEGLRETGIEKRRRKFEMCRMNCWPETVRERCLDR